MHKTVWQTPRPLWQKALEDAPSRNRFHRPELLRFASDTFMDDVQATLAVEATGLAESVARAESWRKAESGWLPTSSFKADEVLKLYQPVHLRYYLVTASLVCQVRGLPDKNVDPADEERVSFVLRRLAQNDSGETILDEGAADYAEYGWFGTAGWKPLALPTTVDGVDGSGEGAPVSSAEERHPLFPLTYQEADRGAKRRLLAGFVPVAAREVYESAPRADTPPIGAADLANDSLRDPRLGEFEARVVYGLLPVLDALDPAPGEPQPDVTTEDVREPFAFALLDLLLFLEANLPTVLLAIQANSSAGLSGDFLNVFDAINRLADYGISLTTLGAIIAERDFIESGQLNLSGNAGTLPGRGLNQLALISKGNIEAALVDLGIRDLGYADPDSLNRRVRDALGEFTGSFETDEPVARPELAAQTGGDVGSVYVLRCVYERPRCRHFGKQPLVSARSHPFRLAGFFDSDAPVRPSRIALPVDTSISGLRKYPKAVSFLISDQLRAQLDRVNGIKLEALDKGEIGEEGGWTLGMICSLSIPIITICAFILLLIIVFVLNIVFWWIPFFRICFPIPLKK